MGSNLLVIYLSLRIFEYILPFTQTETLLGRPYTRDLPGLLNITELPSGFFLSSGGALDADKSGVDG
jgi:hypothetical protein